MEAQERRYGAWLVLTATAYVVCHHLGSVPDGLGSAGHGTRVMDWVDLAVPFVVLTPAALALVAARATSRTWVVFAIGAGLYATGHGVHLSANSVGNVDPGPTAHLWDEHVGHALWYSGVAAVAAALALTMVGRPRPPWWAFLLAGAVGLTWASNALGGYFWVAAAAVVVAAAYVGWRGRRDLTVVLLVAAVPSAALLLAGVL